MCGAFIFVTWLIRVSDMTRKYVGRGSFLWEENQREWRCAVGATGHWLFYLYGLVIHTCDVIHSCIRNNSFVHHKWLIRASVRTHLCIRHDSSTCGTRLILVREESSWVRMKCLCDWPSAYCTCTHVHLQYIPTMNTHKRVPHICKRALNVYKRALHTCKRALFIRRGALHICKRAL